MMRLLFLFRAPFLLEVDEEDGDVGGGDTTDAGCLSNGARADGGEFLCCLKAQTRDGTVVESVGDTAALEAFHACNLFALLLYISVIPRHDLDLLLDICRKRREVKERGERVIVSLA